MLALNKLHHIKTRRCPKIYNFVVVLLIMFVSEEIRGEITLHSHGWVTLESYQHGQHPQKDLNRSQRSEFTGIVDVFRYKAFTFTFLLGNTTDISKNPDNSYFMDRIIYTYTYGGRLDLGGIVIRGDYHHDCIHLINRPEISGSTWWNAYLVRIGTPGAFYLYLPEGYGEDRNGFFKSFDGRVGMAAYRKPGNTIADGKNHNYKYEFSNLVRYHIAGAHKFISFIDLNQRLWITWDQKQEYKGEVTFNLMMRGRSNYAGIYYEYHFYDSYSKDLEDGLGSIGFRILF
jgi:hypothetical protein